MKTQNTLTTPTMNSWVFLVVAALSARDVFSSHYHNGPTAHPQVLHNGYLADTHDVAAAKSAHPATLAHQSHGYVNTHNSHGSEHSHNGDLRYHGPTAIPHVLHNGHIADTHEVAAAKAEHFAAISQAKAHAGHRYNNEASSYGHVHESSYHGSSAAPHILHNGHIADTHEVAAAEAHAGHGYNGASSYGHVHQPSYHGHVTQPVVLKSGYLADTHEVAAAKQHHLHALHSRHSGQHGYSY